MPMKAEEDFGTNSDGSRNSEYCHFCYQNGGFTDPDLKLEDQIERLIEMAETKMNMPRELARETANKVIPKLKRWIN